MFKARDINYSVIKKFCSRGKAEDFANSLNEECFITKNGELI